MATHTTAAGFFKASNEESFPGLQQRASDSEGVRDTWGQTELCGCEVRAEGTVTLFPGWSPSPVQPAGKHHLSCVVTHNLNEIDHVTF